MSNKKIYRGLNKRKKFDFKKFITIVLCLALITGYTYKKITASEFIKNLNITKQLGVFIDKLYFWKDLGADNIESKIVKESNLSDDLKTLSNKQTSSKIDKNIALDEGDSNDVQVAVVEGTDVYLIQVGSFDNQADLDSVQEKLETNKIPNSVLQMDSTKKVQAYVAFDEEIIRQQLSSVKLLFSDAFLAKLDIPVLSLEYTDEYSYVKNISDNLNDLLNNYRQECAYYNANVNNFNYSEYKVLLNNRKTILDNLNKELKKIDYSKLNNFKNYLLSYTSQVEKNIEIALQEIDKSNFYKSESLLISSIQMYYEFINKIKVEKG